MGFTRQLQELIFRMHGYPIKHLPVIYYSKLLDENKPYSFSRFGDGEWNAVLGEKGANCDGHEYFPELGRELSLALSHPKKYLYAMQPYALKSMRTVIEAFLLKNAISVSWQNAEVFHDANKQGRLFPFVNSLRKKSVVMVGPAYLRVLSESLFPLYNFIEVPSVNCYTAKKEIMEAVRKVAAEKDGLVFAFSASMTTNVIIHQLYDELGAKHWLLDLGSLWDIYAGVKSRDVYYKRNWDALIKKNLSQ
jgi:hypothetical protein